MRATIIAVCNIIVVSVVVSMGMVWMGWEPCGDKTNVLLPVMLLPIVGTVFSDSTNKQLHVLPRVILKCAVVLFNYVVLFALLFMTDKMHLLPIVIFPIVYVVPPVISTSGYSWVLSRALSRWGKGIQ